MAVPSSGAISLAGIRAELATNTYNASATTTASLEDCSDGTVATINTDNASADRPDGSAPHAMSEFYAYDHDLSSFNDNISFDFDGTNYITLPFNTTLSEFSFHAWVRPDSTTGDYHAILGKWWDGSNRSFFLTGRDQILKADIAYTDSNADNIFGSTALPDATWSFVCVTWRNYEGLTLTVNDTTETFSINKAIRSNTNSWYIGNQDSRVVKLWDGRISECKMYDNKLSSTEITEIFNATKSAYGL